MKSAATAVRHLTRADPVLARIIERVGPCRLERDRNQFGALVEAILYQQLALKAAQTIFLRFRQIYGNPRGRQPRPEELPRRLSPPSPAAGSPTPSPLVSACFHLLGLFSLS